MQTSPILTAFSHTDVCALLQSALSDKNYKHTPAAIVSIEVLDKPRGLYRADILTTEQTKLVAILQLTKGGTLSVYAIHRVMPYAKTITFAPNFSANKGLSPLLFMGFSTHYNLQAH